MQLRSIRRLILTFTSSFLVVLVMPISKAVAQTDEHHMNIALTNATMTLAPTLVVLRIRDVGPSVIKLMDHPVARGAVVTERHLSEMVHIIVMKTEGAHTLQIDLCGGGALSAPPYRFIDPREKQ